MNKDNFTKALAAKLGMNEKEAIAVLEAFCDCVIENVKKGEKVQIVGFGKFEARKRAARIGVNPQTKAPLKIAASTTPAFKAGKVFKDAVK